MPAYVLCFGCFFDITRSSARGTHTQGGASMLRVIMVMLLQVSLWMPSSTG